MTNKIRAFIVFLFLQLEYCICSRVCFERRKEVGDVFFWVCHWNLFIVKEFFFWKEERKWVMCFLVCNWSLLLLKSLFWKEIDRKWVILCFHVFFVSNWTILLLKSLFLKGERKWVMLCLVSFLFAIELFYCSRVFFEKRKKAGDFVFGVFFVCNWTILKSLFWKDMERANKMSNEKFFRTFPNMMWKGK